MLGGHEGKRQPHWKKRRKRTLAKVIRTKMAQRKGEAEAKPSSRGER